MRARVFQGPQVRYGWARRTVKRKRPIRAGANATSGQTWRRETGPGRHRVSRYTETVPTYGPAHQGFPLGESRTRSRAPRAAACTLVPAMPLQRLVLFGPTADTVSQMRIADDVPVRSGLRKRTANLVDGVPIRGETVACARGEPVPAASALAAANATGAADNIAITSRLMTAASISPPSPPDRYI